MTYRIRLLETEEGWSVSCLDLPGCHSQGDSRDEALANIREAIALWLEVEAEEAPCGCFRNSATGLCGSPSTPSPWAPSLGVLGYWAGGKLVSGRWL